MKLTHHLTGYGGFPGPVWRAADHKGRFAVLLMPHAYGWVWEYETGLAAPKRPPPPRFALTRRAALREIRREVHRRTTGLNRSVLIKRAMRWFAYLDAHTSATMIRMGLKHSELRRRWQDMHHPVCLTITEKLDQSELQEWAAERGVIVHREVSYALRRERWSSTGRHGLRGWYALTDVLDCPDEATQFEARLRWT